MGIRHLAQGPPDQFISSESKATQQCWSHISVIISVLGLDYFGEPTVMSDLWSLATTGPFQLHFHVLYMLRGAVKG